MKKNKLVYLITFLIIFTSLAGCSKAKKPLIPGTTRPGVSGFYVNAPGSDDSLPSLKKHTDVLNEVYPLWYHVKADGSLKEEPNQEAINVAKKNKVKILPLINVVPSQDTILRDQAARDKTIANIVRVVKQNNYDGVNIDFEFIPTTGQQDFRVDRKEMTEFMKLLNQQLKKMGKETHMCVLPHVGVSPEMSGVYDYAGLAPYVDKVTLMCYDHSQAGSPPGPLAPFSWVEQNIKTATKQGFKPSQICLGVATYGYDWPSGQTGGFSAPTKDIMQRVSMKGYDLKWSSSYNEPYYSYTGDNGEKREVWFENAATLQTKIDLVKKYNLAGICIWRLGFEEQKFWNIVVKNWGKK